MVPFPFDDLSGTKVRPAVCLTNEIGSYKHIVIAFITSQLSKATETSDIAILPHKPDFAPSGLKVPSAIRLHRLMTIPVSLIQRELGQRSTSMQTEVEQKLRTLFGL